MIATTYWGFMMSQTLSALPMLTILLILTITLQDTYSNLVNFFFFFFINLFIYFWLHWVFVAARELSLVAASGGHSLLRCAGLSLRWLLLLRSMGSRRVGSVVVARGLSSCGSRAPERGLSSRGTQAQLLRGMWDPPGPGLEPASPALAGVLFTTAPPGKPLVHFLDKETKCLKFLYRTI